MYSLVFFFSPFFIHDVNLLYHGFRGEQNANPVVAAVEFLAKYCRWAVVTLGPSGCIAKHGKEVCLIIFLSLCVILVCLAPSPVTLFCFVWKMGTWLCCELFVIDHMENIIN